MIFTKAVAASGLGFSQRRVGSAVRLRADQVPHGSEGYESRNPVLFLEAWWGLSRSLSSPLPRFADGRIHRSLATRSVVRSVAALVETTWSVCLFCAALRSWVREAGRDGESRPRRTSFFPRPLPKH